MFWKARKKDKPAPEPAPAPAAAPPVATEKLPRFHVPDAELPPGSALEPRILVDEIKALDFMNESYLAEMKRMLELTKFAQLSDEFKQTAHYKSDVTEEQYRRIERFSKRLVPWVSRATDLQNKVVVEIGSGTGSSTAAFAPYVDRIHCFEIAQGPIEIAKQRLYLLGVNNVVFEDGLFSEECHFVKSGQKADIVLLVAVLEHTHFHELTAILRAAKNVLKPGGVIVVAETPNRLGVLDRHTSWMVDYQALPDEIKMAYASNSPRQQFRESMKLFDGLRYGSADHKEHLVRWGSGVSYHDFEIALGRDVHSSIVLDGWEPELRELAPVFESDHLLVTIRDHFKQPISPAFARSWLYFVMQF